MAKSARERRPQRKKSARERRPQRKKSARERRPQRKKSPKQTARQRKKASKRRARGPHEYWNDDGDEHGRDHPSEWHEASLNEMSQEELNNQPWRKKEKKHNRTALKAALLTALAATAGYNAYTNKPNKVKHTPLPQGEYWQPPPRSPIMPKPLRLMGGKRKKKTKKRKNKN